MKKELIVFILIIFMIISLIVLVPLISAQVIINEVMPHTNNDWGDEWVELYNPTNEDIILEGWRINDSQDSDPIDMVIYPHSFALIVNDGANNGGLTGCEAFNISSGSCVELVTIGWHGLNDENETIYLYNNSLLIESFSWDENIKSSGKSWAKNESNLWQKCIPTPGQENYCPQSYFYLEFPPYLIQNEVFAVLINVSGYGNGIYDIKIDIKDQNVDRISRIWDENDEDWQSTNYYVNEVLDIENEQGDYHAFLKIDEDYNGPAYIYSKIRKSSTYVNPIIYLTEIVDFSEQTSQEEEEEEEQDTGSFIEIVDAPENASFGDIVNVKLKLYRGDTGKYAVYVRVEQDNGYDVSEETIIHVLTKYVNYTVKIPVQLRLNCNEKYSEDDYTIIVEGIDETTSQEIHLTGKSSLCSEQEDQEKNEEDYSYSTSETSLETTDKITGNIVRTVETGGSTVLKITPYLLSLLCLLIAFYVIKIK